MGIDPSSGEELPKESVLPRADVLRRLLAGASALNIVDARAKRRAQLPSNVGKGWGSTEDQALMVEFRRGDTIAAMAERHVRTVRAIEARLERLGLKSVSTSANRSRP